MKVEFGKLNICGPRWSGGPAFTPHKFTEPPVVICQLVRLFEYRNDWALHIYPCNITKDGFQCNIEGHYKPGDQIHWIAVGN